MITNVVQKKKQIFVYIDGVQMSQTTVSSYPGSGLKNWNSNTFSVQQGSSLMTYNERGQVIDQNYTGSLDFTPEPKASKSVDRPGPFGWIIDIACFIGKWLAFLISAFLILAFAKVFL